MTDDSYMAGRQRCEAIGVSSLFHDASAGTPDEKHVGFIDWDSFDLLKRPQDFRQEAKRQMMSLGVGDLYVFQTLKGAHGFTPDLMPRRICERFEERMENWGGDGFHRFMGYVNGESVLRVTPKPGEGAGPRLIAHLSVAANPVWSGTHFDFFKELHPAMKTPQGTRWESGGLRLHRYDTTAQLAEKLVEAV